jgi:site-specific recombinase XerD
MAYYRAVVRFFAWCYRHKIGEIADIEPLHVAAYIEALGKDFEKATVEQHLAAIRMLFDWLVTGQVVATSAYLIHRSLMRPRNLAKISLPRLCDELQSPEDRLSNKILEFCIGVTVTT